MTVGVVIPFGGDDPARSFALSMVLGFYQDVFPDWQVALAGVATNGTVSVGHGHARNRAATELDVDVLVFNDADTLCDPEAIEEAVRLATELPGAVFPFTGYRRLSESYTRALVSWRDALDPPAAAVEWGMDRSESHGCVAISHACFDVALGYDPRFDSCYQIDAAANVTWGSFWPIRRMPQDAVHLWHPREEFPPELTAKQNEVYHEYLRRRGQRQALLHWRQQA